MLLCWPFVSPLTCDLIHSVTWLCKKWEYSTQHGLEKWKIARHSYTTWLHPAVWLQQSIERDRWRECVSMSTNGGLWVKQGRTDNHRALSNTLFTPLLCSSEEHVGRISKRTPDSPEGEIKEQREHPTGPQFVFPDFLFYLVLGRSVWVVSVRR